MTTLLPGVVEYDLLLPGRIVFGWGRRRELGRWARSLGRRAFIVHGSRTLETSGTIHEFTQLLTAAEVEPVPVADVRHEPTVALVDHVAALLRDYEAGPGDLVVAAGGGSALDLAKAAAAICRQPEAASVKDYLEGIGRGLQLSAAPLPMLALPTTAGTGSEATKNAVISALDPPAKKSLRDDRMVPDIVLVDPELTVSVPPAVTAATGMDAITQLIESYISRRARPVPRALAIDGLRLALPALTTAYHEPTSRPAREALAQAALLSGVALANSGLGMAHGVAAALGSLADVPHGLACAVMLPQALRVNRQTAEADLANLARETLGVRTDDDTAAADALIDAIDALCHELHIPTRLADLGIRRDQLAALVSGSRGNSMSGNPCELSDEQLRQLLEAML